jgi:hypothetical protein
MSEQLEGICGLCGRLRIECRKNLLDSVKNASEADPINHPSHYTDGGIETIDFIEAKKLNYNCGNAVKYISRAGKKIPRDWERKTPLFAQCQDIEKAIWYLQRELNTLKGK